MQTLFQPLYQVSLCCRLLLVSLFLNSCNHPEKQPAINTDNTATSIVETLRRQYSHARVLQRKGEYDAYVPSSPVSPLPTAYNLHPTPLNSRHATVFNP